MATTSASESAKAYARNVVAGKVPAGKFVKLACQRFLDDLKRKGKDWPYTFDAARADRAIRFMQLMPHTKGKWSAKKERLEFQPWQCFIEANIFGWVVKGTGLRRFRKAYEEEPRKNGKSIRLAARGLYLFAADGESGAEVYSGATTEKQAHEIYRPAWQMVNKLPALRERFGIDQSGNPKNPGPMFKLEDMSKFEPLVGKPGDGSSPHAALIDEYHEHDSDHMVDAMETGMGAREQPLLSIITTAGTNINSPCYEFRRDVIAILEGRAQDETIFGIIYGIDEGDDWQDPASLVKANPNFGVSVFPEFLLAQLEQAKRSATKQSAFRTKHLNEWIGARAAWMNMAAWSRQASRFTIADCAGWRCWIALDLASRKDLAALVMLFERDGVWRVLARFWAPESAAEENERYRKFAMTGDLTLTPGNMTDFAFIEEEVLSLAPQVDLQGVAVDPYQAAYLISRLETHGIEAVSYGNTVLNMSAPMKEVEGLILDGKLYHDGNPLLTWTMGNVAMKKDAKDNVFPRKEHEGEDCKIDGAVALIMAKGLAGQADDSAGFDDFLRNPLVVGR